MLSEGNQNPSPMIGINTVTFNRVPEQLSDPMFATKDNLFNPLFDILIHGFGIFKHSPMIGINTATRQIRNVAFRRLNEGAWNQRTLCRVNVHGRNVDIEAFESTES
jgi:hypothetical protein